MSAWTPPEGMSAAAVRSWRAFFAKAASGDAGYRASWEDYVILYRAQLGRCYICQRAKGINPYDPQARGSQRLGWDHNHATGAVRGLLCTRGERSCNRIVGNFRDNPDAFGRGYQYLTNPPALALANAIRAVESLEERARLATALLAVGKERPWLR
jgi:hypothetical protein